MVNARFVVTIAAAAALAACSNASALKSALPYAPAAATADATGQATHRKSVPVSLKLFIPDRIKHHRERGSRRPDFISAGTNLIYATVYPVGSPGQSVVTATGVAPDSTPCVAVTGGRVCTVSVPAPLGSDVFVFDTLNGATSKAKHHAIAPSAAGGALLYLGQSSPVTQTIVADRTNTVAATVRGIIGEFSTPPNPTAVDTGAPLLLPLDTLDLAPADAESQTIAAPSGDAYYTGYTATLVEHVGGGFATLEVFSAPSLGGTRVALGSSVAVPYDATVQSLGIQFTDAVPPAGYYATITYSGATFTGPGASPQPVAPVTVRLAPMIVSSTSAAWNGQVPSLAFVSASSATLSLSEAALSGLTFTAKLSSGCSGISAKLTQASGTAATVVVTAATVTPAACTLTLSDGTSTVVVPVSVTTTGIPITVPSPSVSEYPLTGAGPLSIAPGVDGNMWFTEATTGRLGTIAIPSFALTEEAASLPGLAGIISGPPGILDTTGLLWFADGAGIGAALPGTPPTYHGPFAPSTGTFGPASLTVGPDGNVWFTDPASNAIGLVTPDGSIEEIPIPTANSEPASIASGDGYVWFTETAGNRVGVLTPANLSIVESAVAAGSKPQGMTFGPDGNIWFTQCGGAAIASASFSGGVVTVTKHATTAGGGPYGIVTGPDRNLWVTETALGRIGRYNIATGTFVDWALPTAASAPRGIATGPDGAIWFTEFSKNRIGRAVNLH